MTQLEDLAARAWSRIYPIFGSRQRNWKVWSALAALTTKEKRALDEEAEFHILQALREAEEQAGAGARDRARREMIQELWKLATKNGDLHVKRFLHSYALFHDYKLLPSEKEDA